MTKLISFKGLFVAEYKEHWQTEATLRNASDLDGREFESLLLQFDRDIESLLNQGGVPALYGTPFYIAYPAMLRGAIESGMHQNTGFGINHIVFLELVDESSDRLITYAFRLDGANYDQPSYFPSGIGELSAAESENGPIRLPCDYVYSANTKQLTITSSKIGLQIQVPEHVIPQLLNCLPIHTNPGPDGSTLRFLRAPGLIEGHVISLSNQRVLLVDPDVLTFNYGVAVQRLWLNRGAFRWLIDADLVVPIG